MKNVEIKARCNHPQRIRELLSQHGSAFVGVDHQTDTYFNSQTGRLKLRQGNIENALIFYDRPDQHGPKLSVVKLFQVEDGDGLRNILEASLGVWIRVEKVREIHFIQNVKFHLDEVAGLGSFMEIEAIDRDGTLDREYLLKQCAFYMQLFDIQDADLLKNSYSDQLIAVMDKGDLGRNA